MKLKNLKHTSWEPVTNKVHSLGTHAPAQLSARKAAYQYEVGHHGTTSVPVVTFISDKNRNVWIGPEQDFYVDLESGILGARFQEGGLLVWCESLVPKQKLSTTNLAEVIQKFEEEIDLAGLNEALRGGRDDTTRLQHLTDLRPAFNPWAFTDGPYSHTTSPSAKIVASEMVDGQVKLQLENPASKFRGEAWIDLKTKKVTKAIESGEKVFPR